MDILPNVQAGTPITALMQNSIIGVTNSVIGMTGVGGISVSQQAGSILISGNARAKSGLLGERMVSFNKDTNEDIHKQGEFVSILGMYNDIPNAQGVTRSGFILKTDTFDEDTPDTTPRTFGVVSQNTLYEMQGEVIVTGLAMALCDASLLDSPADAHGVWIDTADRTGKLVASGGDFPVLGVAATAATGTKHWCLINLDGDYSIPVTPFLIGLDPAVPDPDTDDGWHPELEEETEWTPFKPQDQGEGEIQTDGMTIEMLVRVEYFAVVVEDLHGDQILYGYYRTFKFNARGQLYFVSAETRRIIDDPEDCA